MSDSRPKVVALVLTYNDIENAKRCIQSVCKSDYQNLDIYLIDNNSEMDCVSPIVEDHPSVKVVRLESNGGYAGGFNQGIGHVFKEVDGFDYVWIVTNDLEVEYDTLSKQIEVMENESDIGFMGPETFQRGGSGDHDQWITDLFTQSNPGWIMLDNERDTEGVDLVDVEFVVGHCLLVRKETILDIGLIREFFIYWEEREWQWRGKNAGWRRCVVPGSVCFHDRDSYGKPLNTYYRIRNYIFFNRLVLQHDSNFFKSFVRNIWEELKSCIVLSFRKEWNGKHLRSFIKGFLEGMTRPIPEYQKIK